MEILKVKVRYLFSKVHTCHIERMPYEAHDKNANLICSKLPTMHQLHCNPEGKE
jgi:hypothetical protein